jgi:hypothetical protein
LNRRSEADISLEVPASAKRDPVDRQLFSMGRDGLDRRRCRNLTRVPWLFEPWRARDDNVKRRAVSGDAFDLEPAAMRQDDGTANEEPQTNAVHALLNRVFASMVTLEDVRQIFLSNSDPVVADGGVNIVAITPQFGEDLSSIGAILDGVPDEIVEQLRQAGSVADQVEVGCGIEHERMGLDTDALPNLLSQRDEVANFEIQRETFVVHPLHVEQILDEGS